MPKQLKQRAGPAHAPDAKPGGWGGIRTPGAFRHTRSPGVHNQPLCHPSTLDLALFTVIALGPKVDYQQQRDQESSCSRRNSSSSGT